MMAALVAAGVVVFWKARAARSRCRAVHATAPVYVSFTADADEHAYEDCVVVDCTHPFASTLTHHKGSRNVRGVPASDTSTGMVLNALRCEPSRGGLKSALAKKHVMVNHFDIDALLSVWAWQHREEAIAFEPCAIPIQREPRSHAYSPDMPLPPRMRSPAVCVHARRCERPFMATLSQSSSGSCAVLRTAARIGDFREVHVLEVFPGGIETAESLSDGATDGDQVVRALQLCCWINTQEVQRFSAPYECKDGDDKFSYFLSALGHALHWFSTYQQFEPDLASALDCDSSENTRHASGPVPPKGDELADGYSLPERISGVSPSRRKVALDSDIPDSAWYAEFRQVIDGLKLLRTEGSVVRHNDVGVAIVRSPVPLHYYSLFSFTLGADVVVSIYGQRYEVECKYCQYVNYVSRGVFPRLDLQPLAKALNEAEKGHLDRVWKCPRLNDPGPVLRLEDTSRPLNKAARYGHPCDRDIESSSIDPEHFEALVLSFFRHGLQGTPRKAGGWSWVEMHSINSQIDWSAWQPPQS